MSKFRIFLLSLMVVGISVQLDAKKTEKKQNKLGVASTEEKESNKDLARLISKLGEQKAIELLRDALRKKKTLIDIPLEVMPQILSFIPNDIGNIARISKGFRNLIYKEDEHGNLKLKDNFLRALLFHEHGNKYISMQEKAKKLWEFVARTGCLKVLDNFKEVVGEELDVNRILDKETLERPIHILARYANMKVMNYFFEVLGNSNNEVDIKAQTARGETVIDIAIENGNTQAIRILEYNLKYNSEDDFRLPLNNLFVSLANNNTQSVFLSKLKCCLLEKEKLMFEVVKGGNVKGIKILHNLDKKIIYARDSDSFTPLHVVAQFGKVEAIKVLKELGANLEAQAKNDWTPLHMAARFGKVEAIKTLVELGANTQAKVKDGEDAGKTALDLYKEFCEKELDIEIVKLLSKK